MSKFIIIFIMSLVLGHSTVFSKDLSIDDVIYMIDGECSNFTYTKTYHSNITDGIDMNEYDTLEISQMCQIVEKRFFYKIKLTNPLKDMKIDDIRLLMLSIRACDIPMYEGKLWASLSSLNIIENGFNESYLISVKNNFCDKSKMRTINMLINTGFGVLINFSKIEGIKYFYE